MSTYLLVHGAWHGGWSWRKVVPLLEAKGHRVLTPDLPGHGSDSTPIPSVTLKSYTDRICALAGEQQESVILAGHSMGGIVITQAAEYCPEKIQALVYVCAFLPGNGESLTTWAARDGESMVNPATTSPQADGSVRMKPECTREAFYGACPEEDVALARSRLVAQSPAPFATPLQTTAEGWGRIPRYYIECARDRAITLMLQREMQKHSPCQERFCIETDHSPFFSAKQELANILLRIGSAAGAGRDGAHMRSSVA